MALVNPNIALSVRPVELADPMAQYGKLAAIQQAGNQNALAQYQLGAAKRADETQNMLAQAYSQSVDPATGKIDYSKLSSLVAAGGGGAQIPAIQKLRMEQETALTTQQKAQVDLLDSKLKQSRGFLDTLDPADPTAPARYLAWHEANHKDPIIGAALNARGVSAEQARQSIEAAIAKGPQAFAQMLNQSKLGTEKFMEMNKAQLSTKDTGSTLVDRTFEPLTGRITEIGTTNKTMTPGEVASNKVAQSQLGVSQGQLSLARQKFAFEQANPGFELKEGEDGTFYGVNKRTLQAVPVNVAAPAAAGAAPTAATPLKGKGKDTALTESQGNATAFGMRMMEANKILTDLEKAGKKDTGVIKGVVGSTVGLIPFLGDKLEDMSGSVFNALPQVLGGLTPEQQQVAQARINFITALLRKESGAAIGASEFATAEKNYFPKPGDDDKTIAQKQKARETAIKAMQIQAGPGAKQMGGGGGVPGASANNPLGLPGF